MRLLLTTLVALALATTAHAQIATFSYSFPVGGTPFGIMARSDGEIWVGTSTGLKRFTPAGALLGTVAAATSFGMAEASNGDVFVCDYSGNKVVRYTSAGAFVSQWATGASHTVDVAVDPADNVYVTHYTDAGATVSKLVKYSSTGAVLNTLAGQSPMHGVAFTGGQLYVAMKSSGLVHVYSPTLALAGSFTCGGTFAEELSLDSQAALYLADFGTRTIRVFTTAGVSLGTIPTSVVGYGPITPEGVAVDAGGTIYAGDNAQDKVLVFSAGVTPTVGSSWGRIKALYR